MRRMRHRLGGLSGLLFLAALVLVPVAFAGHQHVVREGQSAPCAVCLTVLHAPATSAPPVAHVDPVFVAFRVPERAPSASSADETPLAVGRAPPGSSADRLA